jgi:hypothetical protein
MKLGMQNARKEAYITPALEIKSSKRGGCRALYYICLIKQRVLRQINNRTHHALSQRKMLQLHTYTQKIYANSTLCDEWRSSRSAVLTVEKKFKCRETH